MIAKCVHPISESEGAVVSRDIMPFEDGSVPLLDAPPSSTPSPTEAVLSGEVVHFLLDAIAGGVSFDVLKRAKAGAWWERPADTMPPACRPLSAGNEARALLVGVNSYTHRGIDRRCVMTLVRLMNSTAGRGARALGGVGLIAAGVVLGGGTGLVLALVGLVPLAAGTAGACLAAPLLHAPLRAR
jgi:hypothetical protein